jgi:hypothetical protein
VLITGITTNIKILKMRDMEMRHDDELESQNLSGNGKSDDRKPSGDDPVSDWLMKMYYYIMHDSRKPI